jgi:hypothetical protein
LRAIADYKERDRERQERELKEGREAIACVRAKSAGGLAVLINKQPAFAERGMACAYNIDVRHRLAAVNAGRASRDQR